METIERYNDRTRQKPGFLENVYKNALLIAMRRKGLQVEVERSFEVLFRGNVVGRYRADLIVEQTVIVELSQYRFEHPKNLIVKSLNRSHR